MGCSLSTKKCLLFIFTILFFGVGVYFRISFLGVLGFYFALTPCICCWIASKDTSDEPRFTYNRPLRSIYQAPDPAFIEKMAERAIELENFLEGPHETSIEEPPIPKGSTTNSLSQKKFQLGDGCELSLELILDVETIVTQSQTHEEKCFDDGKGTVLKKSVVDEGGIKESSKKDDELLELSLNKREDLQLQEFSLNKGKDVELQEFSLGKREDVELQEFSLVKREDKDHQEFSLNKREVVDELRDFSLETREDEERQKFSLDKKVYDEEHHEFSLDKKVDDEERQMFNLDKKVYDEEHQELSLDDEERQKFSLDKKVDDEHQEFSLDKVPLEFLYTLGH